MRTAKRRQEMIARTRSDRASAEKLLRALIVAKDAASRGMRPVRRPDLVGATPASAAMDAAIEGVQRLITTYNASLEAILNDLSDEDLALLDEIDPTRRGEDTARGALAA